MRKLYGICIILITGCLSQCKEENAMVISDADILHNNQFELTEVIIYDIFSPPVASRIYAYASLASYEAMRFQDTAAPSIAEKLNGFGAVPQPEKGKRYNYTLAATKAFFTVVHKVVFSLDTLKDYEDGIYRHFNQALDDTVFQNSLALGDTIGKVILKRAAIDNYLQTRGMPKYLGSKDDGKWQTTPPDYFDGAEPYWGLIMPFSLDTSSQFRPSSPLSFNKDSTSFFYKMVKDVYTTGINLTDSQRLIAQYWDDNPFVMEHTGHMMFANKKITPGGHWMGITAIACKKSNANAVETAQAYALTSIALMDAFISCWDTKYNYEYVRPVTLINKWFNIEWDPFLQTPAFPEYTSGHSTISAAAATVLTYMFGDQFAFHDNSDSAYIGMTRDFSSFKQAADEASISRFYGGIHYRPSLDTGLVCGAKVGANVLKKLGLQ